MEKLKYFSFVLLVALCAGFTSCSDDDDDEPAGGGNAGGIVGVWQGVTSYFCEKANGEIVDEGSYDASDMKWEFKADGSFVWYDYYDGEWWANSFGEYSCSNGKITIRYSNVEEEGGESGSETLSVLEHTQTNLVVEFSYKETHNGVTYEDYEKLTLRRI